MVLRHLFVAPKEIARDARVEGGARKLPRPSLPIVLDEDSLEPVGEDAPIGPLPIVDGREIERRALVAAGVSELLLDLCVNPRGGFEGAGFFRRAERTLDAGEGEGTRRTYWYMRPRFTIWDAKGISSSMCCIMLCSSCECKSRATASNYLFSAIYATRRLCRHRIRAIQRSLGIS